MISMWRKHFSLFMFFVCDDARKNMCDRHRPLFNSIDFGTVPEKKIFLHELKKKR